MTVLSLVAVFVVAGPFVMPVDEYLWRYVHLAVVLAVGFVLASLGAMGAGDAKFAAAMAPFVAAADAGRVAILFAVLLVVTFAAHRIARSVPAVRALAPGWRSWSRDQGLPDRHHARRDAGDLSRDRRGDVRPSVKGIRNL